MIKDIIEEVGSVWDLSFFMMFFNGIGLLLFFDDSRVIGGVDWMFDLWYWEYGKGDIVMYSRICGIIFWMDFDVRIVVFVFLDVIVNIGGIIDTVTKNLDVLKKFVVCCKVVVVVVVKISKLYVVK